MSDPHDDIDPSEVTKQIAQGAREEAEDRNRYVSRRAFLIFVAVFVLAIGAVGWWGGTKSDRLDSKNGQIQAAHSTATAAAKQAQLVADPLVALCAVPKLKAEILKVGGPKACDLATAVKSSPAVKTSRTPAPRRVSAVAIVDQSLVVTYSTGQTANLGRVVGKSGEIGATGKPGRPGKDVTGKPGKDATGKPGKNGDNGVGIVSALPNGAGHLIVTYSDGRTVDAGLVVGPAGKDGVSVTAVTVSDTFHLLVTLSNGTVRDAGQLPPGPAGPKGDKGDKGDTVTGPPGKDGRGVDRSYCGDDGRWTNTYSDGKTGDGGGCRETSTTTVTAPPTSPDPTSTSPAPSSTATQ